MHKNEIDELLFQSTVRWSGKPSEGYGSRAGGSVDRTLLDPKAGQASQTMKCRIDGRPYCPNMPMRNVKEIKSPPRPKGSGCGGLALRCDRPLTLELREWRPRMKKTVFGRLLFHIISLIRQPPSAQTCSENEHRNGSDRHGHRCAPPEDQAPA